MNDDAGLSPPPSLADLSARQSLSLFLDFDGTLVDIAEAPDKVIVKDDLTEGLHRLSHGLDGRVAIITGRPLEALDGYLGRNHIKAVGSHGGEYRGAPLPPPPLSEASLHSISLLHREWPNIFVETKPYGIAVHYRQEPAAASSVLSIMEHIAEHEDLAIKAGKMLVELGPKNFNKGNAVRTLMGTDSLHGSLPIFIGDDVTDEDGFHAVQSYGGHGILVGPPRPSAATYRLNDPASVVKWLGL